jgi:uncharacterized protein involved in exopolysaccharide biosynthesis
MLYVNRDHAAPPKDIFDGSSGPVSIDVRSLLGVLSWQRWKILAPVAVFLLVGLVYVLVRPSAYTAQTNLLVYNSKLSFSREDALFAESQLDPTFLETQMEILKSEKIALDVIDRLGLAGDARSDVGWSPVDLLRMLLGSANDEASNPEMRRRAVLKAFQKDLSVERVGSSCVVNVGFTAPDPEQAARTANEVARAYMDDQNAARFEAAQSASAWLRERIRDLGPRTRIIARASPPQDKSNVRGLLVLAIAGLAGLALAVGAVIAREFFNRKTVLLNRPSP